MSDGMRTGCGGRTGFGGRPLRKQAGRDAGARAVLARTGLDEGREGVMEVGRASGPAILVVPDRVGTWGLRGAFALRFLPMGMRVSMFPTFRIS